MNENNKKNNPVNRQNNDNLRGEETLHENKKIEDLMDESVFDETLKEIDSAFKIFEQKTKDRNFVTSDADILPRLNSAFSKKDIINEEKNLLENNNLILRIKNLEMKINKIEVSLLKDDPDQIKNSNTSNEHKINEDSLSLSEIYNIGDNNHIKKESSLGFFFYIILINLIFLFLYGTLIYLKDIIILNFPFTEKHIIHFFEVANIVKVTISEFINYFK